VTLPGWVGVREPRGRLGGRYTKNVTICPTYACTKPGGAGGGSGSGTLLYLLCSKGTLLFYVYSGAWSPAILDVRRGTLSHTPPTFKAVRTEHTHLAYRNPNRTANKNTNYTRTRTDCIKQYAYCSGGRGRRGTATGAGGTPGRIIMVVEASRAERAAPASATSRSWSVRIPWRCTLPLRSSQAAPAILARHATP